MKVHMIYEFVLFVIASLVANWIWDWWIKRLAAKGRKAKILKGCLEKIEHCSHELDYNATPGIGGSRCPFITEAQQKFLYSEEIVLVGDDLKESLKNLIIDAGRANGEWPSVTPGSVKSGSNLLKKLLQQKGEELKASEKSVKKPYLR
jgi:hypothetical protein